MSAATVTDAAAIRLHTEEHLVACCILNPALAKEVEPRLISDLTLRECIRIMRTKEIESCDTMSIALAVKNEADRRPTLDRLNRIDTLVETTQGFAGYLAELGREPETIGFPAFYDISSKCYWIEADGGGWIPLNDAPLKMHMRKAGIPTDREKAKAIDAKIEDAAHWVTVEDELCRIQTENHIRFAGPLAGHWPGLHIDGANQILVTEAPKLIEPKERPFPLLKAVITGLLSEDGATGQSLYFRAWLKVAYEALRQRKKMPGQSLVLAGPRNCGKSLLQWIITECLGGRSAKPYRYMSGLTTFNSDLFEAEHLMIEDDVATTDIRKRRAFGSEIKGIAVNETHSHHGKNKNALTLRPFWRLSVSVNNEPENLMILPPMDDSIADKIILLKAKQFEMPMPTGSPDEREKFRQAMAEELPGLLHNLMQWEIPEEMKCRRFGVTHYHHPDLLEALEVLAPESRLLELIDSAIHWTDTSTEWRGTAQELERLLRDSSYGHEAGRLFTYPTACGTYLGRLAAKHPERVEQNRTSAKREWMVRKAMTA